MTPQSWIQSNGPKFETILDGLVNDPDTLEEIKNAVADCLQDNGFNSSGCSVIDALAVRARNNVIERINFERDYLGGEDLSDEDSDDLTAIEEHQAACSRRIA